MPAPYENLLNCTLGPDGFQVQSYSVSREPIVDEKYGRTGTRIRAEGIGFIEGTAADNFAAKVKTADLGFDVTGEDFSITGLGGFAEFELTAASCRNGGPHVSFEILPQLDLGPLRKAFKFTLVAESGAFHLVKTRTRTGPDGLREVSLSGEISGPGAGATWATALTGLAVAYPWPTWVVSYEFEKNPTDDQANYTATAKELAGTLPGVAPNQAVDGSAIEGSDRDEQYRVIRSLSYDLLIKGDPNAVLTAIRPEGSIFRERTEIQTLGELRVRAQFVFLESAYLNAEGQPTFLLDFQQELEWTGEDGLVKAIEYPGASPIIIKAGAATPQVRVVRGRALGLGRFPKEPAPPVKNGQDWSQFLQAPKRVRHNHVNKWEKETTWEYTFVFAVTPQEITKASLDRPAMPLLYEASE